MTAHAATVCPSDAEIVDVTDRVGSGNVLIVCEHASKRIPASFGGLGLNDAALNSHIAWDPGALAVANAMAERLGATLIAQRFSRLLYDCNRPPESPAAVPEVSEVFEIPGNTSLSAADRKARVERFYLPFRETLAACIGRRIDSGHPPVLVTVHSFTPVYKGIRRAVELGILHGADARLANAMIASARDATGLTVRRNEPYGPVDGVLHTLDEHANSRGLLNVMLEIRNDLIADRAGQARMADLLAFALSEALDALAARSEGREDV